MVGGSLRAPGRGAARPARRARRLRRAGLELGHPASAPVGEPPRRGSSEEGARRQARRERAADARAAHGAPRLGDHGRRGRPICLACGPLRIRRRRAARGLPATRTSSTSRRALDPGGSRSRHRPAPHRRRRGAGRLRLAPLPHAAGRPAGRLAAARCRWPSGAARRAAASRRARPTRSSRAGPVGERVFDDLYTGIEQGPASSSRAAAAGSRSSFDDGYPWAQVYAPRAQELRLLRADDRSHQRARQRGRPPPRPARRDVRRALPIEVS